MCYLFVVSKSFTHGRSRDRGHPSAGTSAENGKAHVITSHNIALPVDVMCPPLRVRGGMCRSPEWKNRVHLSAETSTGEGKACDNLALDCVTNRYHLSLFSARERKRREKECIHQRRPVVVVLGSVAGDGCLTKDPWMVVSFRRSCVCSYLEQHFSKPLAQAKEFSPAS